MQKLVNRRSAISKLVKPYTSQLEPNVSTTLQQSSSSAAMQRYSTNATEDDDRWRVVETFGSISVSWLVYGLTSLDMLATQVCIGDLQCDVDPCSRLSDLGNSRNRTLTCMNCMWWQR